MLVSNILLTGVALAGTVLADGKAIVAAMNKIKADTADLGNHVAAFKGDILGVLPIAMGSLHLLDDIKKGTKTADASAPLTTPEALELAGATGDLSKEVNKTLTAIIATKPKFDKLLVVSPIILLNLEQQQKATKDFSAKVVSKVPESLKGIAQALIKPIDDGFTQAIAKYKLF
ncbi:antigenic cell wall galactomannoprotein [Purpureocillium lavendulum]|uniref:Antigenic cell wall galactomannoprotein n=1 Tax=Purpureocillium lavendulum TaxID=1247861 RepID=A0AB34G0K0_9HYPO|nr:antigenic cell wall galactomannoprotein [Purpureocillium lavendulum]